MLIKGSFMNRVMKSRTYKYAVKTCAFEAGNNDVEKGRKIFGAVQDDFYALEFFKMSLRFVYELSDKYGTAKGNKKTKFGENLDVSSAVDNLSCRNWCRKMSILESFLMETRLS